MTPLSPMMRRLKRLFLPPRPDPAQSRHIAEMRLIVSGFVALAVFAVIAGRVVVLSAQDTAPSNDYKSNVTTVERGKILDRKGRLLATNLPITVMHADPSEIMDVNDAAKKLAPFIARHNEASLKRLLMKKTRYVELDRKVTPARHAQILQLGIPGVYFAEGHLRAYPRGNAAAHVLGHVDPDNNGLAGIEKAMNAELASGANVTLSIDAGVQNIMATEIARQIEEYEALGGAGVMLDVNTGELLAMVSLPDYNPNHYGAADDNAKFNRASKGVYEMGSTFKVLNTAIFLEAGLSTSQKQYEVAKPIRISRFTINDYHVYQRPLNVAEILIYSSNIGSARMADDIGAELQRTYMERLGLLDRLPLELPETARPLVPSRWKRVEAMTVSYGHGISITLPHLASAVSTASANGLWIPPTLIKKMPGEQSVRTRVFSDETARSVRSMMRFVVSHEDGTANYAEAPGYMVGGKTGTAEKNIVGGYDKKVNLTTFVATFPVHDPRYVIAIIIDAPKGQKKSGYRTTGGWVVAPAVKRIVERAAPVLKLHPVDEKLPEIRHLLDLDFKIGNEEATNVSY